MLSPSPQGLRGLSTPTSQLSVSLLSSLVLPPDTDKPIFHIRVWWPGSGFPYILTFGSPLLDCLMGRDFQVLLLVYQENILKLGNLLLSCRCLVCKTRVSLKIETHPLCNPNRALNSLSWGRVSSEVVRSAGLPDAVGRPS